MTLNIPSIFKIRLGVSGPRRYFGCRFLQLFACLHVVISYTLWQINTVFHTLQSVSLFY